MMMTTADRPTGIFYELWPLLTEERGGMPLHEVIDALTTGYRTREITTLAIGNLISRGVLELDGNRVRLPSGVVHGRPEREDPGGAER